MGFFKKLFKNKKGSELVEKIIMLAFSVAMGGAVILYTAGIINENKDLHYAGSATFVMSTEGDFSDGNVASKNDISLALCNNAFSKYDSYIGMNSGGRFEVTSQKERLNQITITIEENEFYPASWEVVVPSTGTLNGTTWTPEGNTYSVSFNKPSGKQVRLKEIHVECDTGELNFVDYDMSSVSFTTSSAGGFDSSLTKTEGPMTVTFVDGSTTTYIDTNHIRLYQRGRLEITGTKPIKEIRIDAQVTTSYVFDFTSDVGDIVGTTWYADNDNTYGVTLSKPNSGKQSRIRSIEVVYLNT